MYLSSSYAYNDNQFFYNNYIISKSWTWATIAPCLTTDYKNFTELTSRSRSQTSTAILLRPPPTPLKIQWLTVWTSLPISPTPILIMPTLSDLSLNHYLYSRALKTAPYCKSIISLIMHIIHPNPTFLIVSSSKSKWEVFIQPHDEIKGKFY